MPDLAVQQDLDADLSQQFDDVGQQKDASILGMWAFLASEVMFFGGLIAAFIIYRFTEQDAFIAASRRLSVLLGGVNTAVLLTSSLTMAMAVHAARERKIRPVVVHLCLTIVLGVSFLGIKGLEYYNEYRERLMPVVNYAPEGLDSRGSELFFVFYFCMTLLHGFHMIVGIVIVGIIAALWGRRWFSPGNDVPIEVIGLYWHFVDVVWVFLYPLLYLISVRK